MAERRKKGLQLVGEMCRGALCGVPVKPSCAEELQPPWLDVYL